MSKYEFVELFLQTNNDVKIQVEMVLRASKQHLAPEELHFENPHIIQEPFEHPGMIHTIP